MNQNKQEFKTSEKYFNKTVLRNFFRVNSTIIISVIVCGLALWVFLPQLSNLQQSITAAKSANKTLLVFAVLVFCLGFPGLALKYVIMCSSKIYFYLTFKVQIAAAFIIKLLPTSVGSLTVNTFYLTKATGSITTAGSTMALNAATSTVAFTIILGFAFIKNLSQIDKIAFGSHNINWPLIGFVILALGIVVWKLIHSKELIEKIKKSSLEIWSNFKNYSKTPWKVVGGIGTNGFCTLTGITTLYICTHAVDLNTSFSQVIIVYTLGNILASLVPTPGGLGGAEAGLYAGLVFFGYNSETSLVAVLIYRLISYWMPIIPGYLMYRHLKKTTLSGFRVGRKKTIQQSV